MLKTSGPDRQKEPSALERRRSRRVALSFHIEVSGTNTAGTVFRDQAVTTDVSAGGCQFLFHRKLGLGQHLSLELVNTDFAHFTGNRTQLFEVVWTEPSHQGWTIGVKKLEGENIWPLTFPIHRKPQR
jgi:hypothetical protein